ncbi:hypothetical protein GGI07_004539 [Coemansia sp. Benny D115]|nr:hypothetical protein GGI07_004539 [Coemansia sp. Benny D115]
MVVNNITLNNGVLMPEVGLGTWKGNEEGELTKAIKTAVDVGYRHIDCAKFYGNQPEIGKALSELTIPRKEMFIVSKFWQTKHRPELVAGALDEILDELQLEYLDLLLMHFPFAVVPESKSTMFPPPEDLDNVPIMDTWRAMEALLDTGKVRAIGVSNFNKSILAKMIPQCRVIPAVNQIEIQPYYQSPDLVDFCQQNGIAVTGFAPLGGNGINVMDNEFIKRIADTHICTPAQVILSWVRSRGIAVIPKSTNEIRMKQNLESITLTKDEKLAFKRLDKNEPVYDPFKFVKELEWVLHDDRAKCPLI